jgi:serine/threonine protein kinase
VQDPRPDEVLAGKYRLVRLLGKGGMGHVWLADHLTLSCPVAIKIIDPAIASDPDFRARFLREARAAAAIRSPHVVQILDHGVEDGSPYIVMELLEGESLAQRLWRAQRLSPLETARILNQVGRATTRAHEAGVIHRDLKPDNIFLVANDEEELAKVLDFGIAKATSATLEVPAAPTTDTGRVLGTCFYMSPEQAAGAKSVDHRTDIWSLGVIAFECLLGRRPFEGETLGRFFQAIYGQPAPVPSRHGAVPAGFDDWFARACAHDVGMRFASAREACAELRRICDQPATAAPTLVAEVPTLASEPRALPATEVDPSTGAMMAHELGPRQRRGARGAPIAVIAAAAALAIGLFVARRPAPPPPPAGRAADRAATNGSAPAPAAPATPPVSPSASPSAAPADAAVAGRLPASPAPASVAASNSAPVPPGPGQAHRRAKRKKITTEKARTGVAAPSDPDRRRSSPRVDLGL